METYLNRVSVSKMKRLMDMAEALCLLDYSDVLTGLLDMDEFARVFITTAEDCFRKE